VPSELCEIVIDPDATTVPLYNWILLSVEVEYTVVPFIAALKPPDITQPPPNPEPFNVHAIVDVFFSIF
jgi:hypothetical protein